MGGKLDLSLIIPCYFEEAVLEESMRELTATLDATRFSYEIIFVDDGSLDETRKIIERIISEDRGKHLFKKIFHEKNIGRGGAVNTGMRNASGEVAGFIDIDLEVQARYIPAAVLAIRNGADVVVAHRIYKFSLRSLGRHILSRGYAYLRRRFLDIPLNDTESGFKFFNRKKILPVIARTENLGWFWDTEIMVRAHLAHLDITELPCLFIRRFDKKSTVQPISDSWKYFKNLVRFRRKLRREKKAG